jgi:hypothetical protein
MSCCLGFVFPPCYLLFVISFSLLHPLARIYILLSLISSPRTTSSPFSLCLLLFYQVLISSFPSPIHSKHLPCIITLFTNRQQHSFPYITSKHSFTYSLYLPCCSLRFLSSLSLSFILKMYPEYLPLLYFI